MKRILVIEDDGDHREFLKTILESEGYEVVEAVDGEDGIRMFRQEPCDLIVTDIFMPRTTGEEAILELKQLNPGVKIIAVSGGGAWTGRKHIEPYAPLLVAKNFGADRTLTKPLKTNSFLKTVKEMLEND